jgi:hypothetical protein
LRHKAANRSDDGRIGERLFEHSDLCVDSGDASAGRFELFTQRAGLEPRDNLPGGPYLVSRAAEALARDVDPRLGVIALLLGTCVCFQQRFEALEIGFRGRELRLGGRGGGGGGVDLRLRLTDVFAARAGLQQAELRVGRRALRPRAVDLQLDISRVEACNDITCRDAIAFGHPQLQQAPPDFGGHLDLGCLHMAGYANGI